MPPGPVEPDTLSLWMELFSVMFVVFSPPLRLLSNCRNFVHLESRIAEADRRLLRWLNTVLAVCEYMSFAKLWQEERGSSQAETWRVKNILRKDFD